MNRLIPAHYPLGAGVLIGLLASQHLIVVAATCLLLGVVLGRSWAGIARLSVALVHRLTPREQPAPAPYNRELDECDDCGAHRKGQPCYFPARSASTHPSFDPWSRRVP